MSERYIEINSLHRNREQFPEPSRFDVPFASNRIIKTGVQAFDPVINGMIYFNYNHTIPLDEGYIFTGSTDSSVVLHSTSSVSPPSLFNYYTGCVISIIIGNELQTRSITDYFPGSLTVVPDVSFSGVALNQPYVIMDFSTADFLHLIIPDTEANHLDLLSDEQSCTGFYVMDETLSYGTNIVARIIKYYDYTLRYAYYDKEMPIGWQSSDSYSIRKTLPKEKWRLDTEPSHSGGFLYVTLPVAANSSNGFYKGMYIYFYTSQHVYSTYYVTSYDGFYRKATCYMNPSQQVPTPKVGDTINIVTFSHDNFAPLNYIGTMVSMNQTVCYEVALLRLVLPNVPLRTGARIAFYPYLYVELSNITSPTGASRNIIYSNNPDSGKALFIVPVRDMVLPVNSHFVKLIGRTRQTIKFKPNDSLRFSVYLPNGDLFAPSQEDLKSPYDPNYRLQVNAVFAIRRL
jgi:hypothetical protein